MDTQISPETARDAGADSPAEGTAAEASSRRQEAGAPESPLPKDVVFGLLSVQRRRRILAYLAEHEGEATLSDLAEHVASLENDKPVGALTSAERKRVYVCFYQSHLPKLADAGVIDYNQARGTVRLRRAARQLYAYLTISPGNEDETEPSVREKVSDSLGAMRAKFTD